MIEPLYMTVLFEKNQQYVNVKNFIMTVLHNFIFNEVMRSKLLEMPNQIFICVEYLNSIICNL